MRNLKELFHWKWFILLTGMYAFSYVEVRSITKWAFTEHIQLSFYDVALQLIGNIYLMLYFVVPFFIFQVTRHVNQHFNDVELIRFRSYFKWGINQLNISLVNILGIIICYIFNLVIFNLSLSLKNEWGLPSNIIHPDINSIFLENAFTTPILALLMQFLQLILGLLLIGSGLILWKIYIPNEKLLQLVAALVFIINIFSFKMFPDSLKFLRLPNYLTLYHSVQDFGNGYSSILLTIILMLIFCLLWKMKDFRVAKIRGVSAYQFGIMIYGSILIIGTYFMIQNFIKEKTSFINIFLQLLYGTHYEGYTYMAFLYYIIIFFGFIYLLQIRMIEELDMMSFYKIIRYRSYKKWFVHWFWIQLKSCAIFLIVLLLVSIVIWKTTLVNVPFTTNKDYETVGIVAYHYFVNGLLQLVLYILLISCLFQFYRDYTISLITLSVFLISMMFGLSFLPVGLNGYGHVLMGTSASIISVYLVILNIVAIYIFVRNMKIKNV
ncbi:hypothetical protein [Lysinibacillus fusiformis]|uniref:hypothetical protein n=1 Tax=Lysinibacillus fusiformis TaxID=28031 RepID=UPI0035575E84